MKKYLEMLDEELREYMVNLARSCRTQYQVTERAKNEIGCDVYICVTYWGPCFQGIIQSPNHQPVRFSSS